MIKIKINNIHLGGHQSLGMGEWNAYAIHPFFGPRCDSVTLESCLLCQPKLDWVAPWTPQNKTEKKIKINENMIKELKRERRKKKSHEYKPHLF